MKIHFVSKSLWFMQNNNGVKQRYLDCFLKILDKKRKKNGENYSPTSILLNYKMTNLWFLCSNFSFHWPIVLNFYTKYLVILPFMITMSCPSFFFWQNDKFMVFIFKLQFPLSDCYWILKLFFSKNDFLFDFDFWCLTIFQLYHGDQF